MINQKLNAVKFGIAAGIVFAIITFLSTILGIYGLSQAAEFMATTVWVNYGYSVTWVGAFIGLIIGFIYGFVPLWIGIVIYNKLVS